MPRGIPKTDSERRDDYERWKKWRERRNKESPLKSPCLLGRRKHKWIRVYENKFKKFYVPLHTGSFKFDNDICSWCGKTRGQAKEERKRK